VIALEYETNSELRSSVYATSSTRRVRAAALERVAIHHRIGRVELSVSTVVVAVSAPHRDAAFAAAQFCIDALKASVPMWKRELWEADRPGVTRPRQSATLAINEGPPRPLYCTRPNDDLLRRSAPIRSPDLRALPAKEIELNDALGLVTAGTVRAREPSPRFANSAMDASLCEPRTPPTAREVS